MEERIILKNLTPQDLIHPQEKSALIKILEKIPGGKSALNGIGELYGKFIAINYYGNGVVVTEESMPELSKQFKETCKIVGLDNIPELAMQWAYRISSFTVGGKNLRIVLSTGAIDLLAKEEIPFLLGQEIGHIIAGHTTYHMLLELLYTPFLESTPLKTVAGVIKMPMLDWFRKSHYTADRVALLCCQDINVAIKCMMKMAGLPKKYYEKTDPKTFLLQAREFAALKKDGWATGMISNILLRAASLPWMVDRVTVLMEWYESGEYQEILDRK